MTVAPASSDSRRGVLSRFTRRSGAGVGTLFDGHSNDGVEAPPPPLLVLTDPPLAAPPLLTLPAALVAALVGEPAAARSLLAPGLARSSPAWASAGPAASSSPVIAMASVELKPFI